MASREERRTDKSRESVPRGRPRRITIDHENCDTSNRLGILGKSGVPGLSLLSQPPIKRKKVPEKSQWEEALDEPPKRTSRTAVVIGAPACYVSGLKP